MNNNKQLGNSVTDIYQQQVYAWCQDLELLMDDYLQLERFNDLHASFENGSKIVFKLCFTKKINHEWDSMPNIRLLPFI